MKTYAKQLIGKRVRIKCYTYKNGKTLFGIVKNIAKNTQTFTTANVLIDGNYKCTKLATIWLTVIN